VRGHLVLMTDFTAESEIPTLAISAELINSDKVEMGAMDWKQFGSEVSIVTRWWYLYSCCSYGLIVDEEGQCANRRTHAVINIQPTQFVQLLLLPSFFAPCN
jgi:hypothetical protein